MIRVRKSDLVEVINGHKSMANEGLGLGDREAPFAGDLADTPVELAGDEGKLRLVYDLGPAERAVAQESPSTGRMRQTMYE